MDEEAMKARIKELEDKCKDSEIKCAELRGAVKSTSERIVVRSKPDSKVPKFNENMDVEDWIDSIRSHLTNLSSNREQVDFVMNHLDSKPYREVRLRIERKKASFDQIFDVLIDVFGIHQTQLELQEEFFMRKQQTGENIDDYAYTLMDLVITMENKHHMNQADADAMLKSHFANGVSNINLRHELCRLNRDRDSFSFTDLRQRAHIWIKEHEETTDTLTEATSVATSVETAKWDEVQQCLMVQQEQIKQLTLSQEHTASNRGNNRGRYNNSDRGYYRGNYNNPGNYNRGNYNNQGLNSNYRGQYNSRSNNSRSHYNSRGNYTRSPSQYHSGYTRSPSQYHSGYTRSPGQYQSGYNNYNGQSYNPGQYHAGYNNDQLYNQTFSAQSQANVDRQSPSAEAPQVNSASEPSDTPRGNHTAGSGPQPLKCYYCYEPNHIQRDCFKRKQDQRYSHPLNYFHST